MTARSPFAPLRAVADPSPTESDPVLTVSQLNARLRGTLRGLGFLSIEGEVGGLKGASASGHLYFTLKDEREDASIQCAMWRRDAQIGGGDLLVNGARVRVRAEVTLYSPRGALQIVVTKVTPAGAGALLLAKEQLKKKLAAEGLFDAAKKRPLPSDPRVVGVVTSAHGAAFQDIVKVASRRGPVRILLAPANVQGDDAPAQLRAALARLAAVDDVEVIIVGRGGGSAEDLAAFDDEGLARAIAACRKPVVAAVGHEVDWSIADLVADVRAATPSQAAELVVPDDAARRARLDDALRRLTTVMRGRLHEDRAVFARLRGRLRAPDKLLAQHRQRLDELTDRATTAVRLRLARARKRHEQLRRRLAGRHPRAVLDAARAGLAPMVPRLHAAIRARLATLRAATGAQQRRLRPAVEHALEGDRNTLANLAGRLHAVSPLAVLARGYAIAIVGGGDGTRRAVRRASDVAIGDAVEIRLHEGTIDVEVKARRHE